MALTTKDKDRLRAYWRGTYTKVEIRQNGEVWAQRFPGESFGLLETAAMAEASAKVLATRSIDQSK